MQGSQLCLFRILLCCALIGPKTYRLLTGQGQFHSPPGALLCQYSEMSLDIEKEKNNLLCQLQGAEYTVYMQTGDDKK